MPYQYTQRIKNDYDDCENGEYLTKQEKYILDKLNCPLSYNHNPVIKKTAYDAYDSDGILELISLLSIIGNDSGVFIAGGAVASCFYNKLKEASDVDLWFSSLTKMHGTISCLVSNSYYRPVSWTDLDVLDDNPSSIKYIELLPNSNAPVKKKLQLIKMKWYNSAIEVINDFDMAHCQFSISKEHHGNITNDYNIYTTELSLKAAQEKKIYVRGTAYPATLFSRINKYVDRGFTFEGSSTFAEELKVGKSEKIEIEEKEKTEIIKELWDIEEYRNDYMTMEPARLAMKWPTKPAF